MSEDPSDWEACDEHYSTYPRHGKCSECRIADLEKRLAESEASLVTVRAKLEHPRYWQNERQVDTLNGYVLGAESLEKQLSDAHATIAELKKSMAGLALRLRAAPGEESPKEWAERVSAQMFQHDIDVGIWNEAIESARKKFNDAAESNDREREWGESHEQWQNAMRLFDELKREASK
jgi:hypothetical protein